MCYIIEIKMNYIMLIVVTVTTANCDWVEIPQATVSSGKGTKHPDYTSYVLTTWTTVQTPILLEPTVALTTFHTSNHTKRVNLQSNKAVVLPVDNLSSTETSSNSKANLVINSNTNDNSTNHNNSNSFSNSAVSDTTYQKNNNLEETDAEYYYDKNDNTEEFVNQEKQEEYGYSYVNFIPYMSTIQSTLMKSAHKNKKSKLNVLQQLRDHLLSEIQRRMTSLWKPISESREAREYKDDSHVDFPSNEGALMTIGFLTFAVFLIKLVMQLIQAIGNKVDSNNGTTTTTLIGRKRRAAADEEAIQILNYIEQYRFK